VHNVGSRVISQLLDGDSFLCRLLYNLNVTFKEILRLLLNTLVSLSEFTGLSLSLSLRLPGDVTEVIPLFISVTPGNLQNYALKQITTTSLCITRILYYLRGRKMTLN
jgi:hypothetical protein